MTSTLAAAMAAEMHDAAVIRLREESSAALFRGDLDIAAGLEKAADDLDAAQDQIGGTP
ncbi:hypothetical protein [Nocardia sp.]|uniref:hypothetical protein n=1 Tax=Nocardia sp. TaxID=1821 RepID=UPI00261539A3|nr:hypothetical protein [Nocardia sp.]